ncbi:hypothetical protein TRICI_002414 [Trichomonascus ciferrii]|uniref:RRM domain-containing protein n=1 Tax=Trichomonascus ciferrii TaxID=44093 RepID=A0A642V7Z9_9ASCO|nr:hypothetical protein TRICI_002414 [Trichomonascus ciferrii]
MWSVGGLGAKITLVVFEGPNIVDSRSGRKDMGADYEIDLDDQDDGYSNVEEQAPQGQYSSPATGALLIGNLDWWTNEEDVRGWAVDAEVEDKVKCVLFDEIKQNARSKGIVYVELRDTQSASKLKQKLDSLRPPPINAEGNALTTEYTYLSPTPFRPRVPTQTTYPSYYNSWRPQQRTYDSNASNPHGLKRQRN